MSAQLHDQQSLTHRIAKPVKSGRDRYAVKWVDVVTSHYASFLRENQTILDVGSGRRPAVPIAERPAGCTYIGLDISAEELRMAPDGSYDVTYARDLGDREANLEDAVDLALSWQVLEHIEHIDLAINNVRSYLKPTGTFFSVLSGRNAHFAIINRILPERFGKWAMKRLLNREPDSVFHAYYDRCTATDLLHIFVDWDDVLIIPEYRGASYFAFSKFLRRLYLRYENWCVANGKVDLATHYVIIAKRVQADSPSAE